MEYEKTIFQRMNLQQICAFILNGSENFEIESKPYNERLATGSDAIYSRLKSLCDTENDFEKASSDLSQALITYEKVYTEIGMKAGVRIIFQLLHKDLSLTEEN